MMIPVIVMAIVFLGDTIQAVTGSDYDVRDTIDLAVRAANYQVERRSQAAGDARVLVDQAHSAFRSSIAYTLRLDPNALAPLSNSPLKSAPQYILVVYNGDNAYSAQGAPAGRIYRFNGVSVTTTNLSALGFPSTFAVYADDIIQGGFGGVARVTLQRPGCVVWMKAESRKAAGKESVISTRWTASQIHYW